MHLTDRPQSCTIYPSSTQLSAYNCKNGILKDSINPQIQNFLLLYFQSKGDGISPQQASSSNPAAANTPSTAYTKVILKNSVIKGYHVFKIRPPYTNPATRLTVDREYTNRHDEHACLVWLPALDTFSIDMHNMFTDEKRQLKLTDIAGLPIGHVPKCLSSVFRHVLDEGGEIHAEVTGEPVPSFAPWPEPQSEGGGVVLPCN